MKILLNWLHCLGVKNFILSASPTIFVEGIKEFLPVEKVIGIDVEIEDGKLTNIVTVLPYNLGKRQIVENILEKNCNLKPIIGVGNSINNDYPFLSLLLGLGAVSAFVLDPSNNDQNNQNNIIALGLTPIFVQQHVVEIPDPSVQQFMNMQSICINKNCCDGNKSCFPIIPFQIYKFGEISAR